MCTHTQFKDAEITTLSAGIQNEVLVATVLQEKLIGFSSQMQLKDANIAERDKVFESLKTLIASRELEIKILKEEIAVKDLDLHERVFRTAHAQKKWDNLETERLRTQLSSDDLPGFTPQEFPAHRHKQHPTDSPVRRRLPWALLSIPSPRRKTSRVFRRA